MERCSGRAHTMWLWSPPPLTCPQRFSEHCRRQPATGREEVKVHFISKLTWHIPSCWGSVEWTMSHNVVDKAGWSHSHIYKITIIRLIRKQEACSERGETAFGFYLRHWENQLITFSVKLHLKGILQVSASVSQCIEK